jgi:EpsI family protein
MNNKTFIAVSVFLTLTAALALSTYLPHRYDFEKEPQVANLPKIIGEWQGKDLPLEERDYQILATRNLIMRQYDTTGKPPVYLYVIYSGDNRKSLHPPEICYSGSGSTMLEKSVIQLTNTLQVNRFLIESSNARQSVVYWFRSGTLNTPSFVKQQFRTALQRTFLKRPSGAMVRISTDIVSVKSENEKDALARIGSFATQIVPLLDKYAP